MKHWYIVITDEDGTCKDQAGLRILFTNIWTMQIIGSIAYGTQIAITGTLKLLMFASRCFPQA
jgi:hypothetical protein